MYTPAQLALKYLRYYLTAANGRGHGTHSPFVFHFITRVLNDKTNHPDYTAVESLRAQLKKDERELEIEDYGAGSVKGTLKKRTVSSIARNATKPPKFGQLLHRMVKAYQPARILELGTSLGITSAYLSKGKPDSTFITLEGATQVADLARKNLDQLQVKNAEIVVGNFDDTLKKAIVKLTDEGRQPVDFVFIDGNHRQEPTERYFRDLLPHTGNDSMLVFDDIHWSREMENAWATIQAHPSVRCTIDLFFIGIVFFRQEFREKQHFTIRF